MNKNFFNGIKLCSLYFAQQNITMGNDFTHEVWEKIESLEVDFLKEKNNTKIGPVHLDVIVISELILFYKPKSMSEYSIIQRLSKTSPTIALFIAGRWGYLGFQLDNEGRNWLDEEKVNEIKQKNCQILELYI